MWILARAARRRENREAVFISSPSGLALRFGFGFRTTAARAARAAASLSSFLLKGLRLPMRTPFNDFSPDGLPEIPSLLLIAQQRIDQLVEVVVGGRR